MSAEAAFTSTWRVGRYTATLSVPKPRPGAVLSAVIEWSPNRPASLSSAEWNQYRVGRNAAMAAMAEAMGINAAVIDL
jgi:hypothetical protein